LMARLIFSPDHSKWFFNSRCYSGTLVTVIFALNASLIHDLILTTTWTSGYATVQKMKAQFPGCNVISNKAFKHVFARPFGFRRWWFPYLTMAPERGLNADSIFFVEATPTGHSCRVRNDGRFESASPRYGIWTSSTRFDYSAVVDRKIHIHNWDANQRAIRTTSAD
jgi:hypothetical protein